jgi:hypothetical protein
MLRKLVVALAVLAIAAPAFAFVASKDGSMVTTPNSSPVDQPLGDRADVEFNTGGAMGTPATTAGSASGWAYYTMNVYTNGAAQDIKFLELGFPTNAYSTDPIALPVEWNIDLNNNDVYSVVNPYSHAWDGVGTFTPTGVIDTSPPTVYSLIDISANNIVLPAGASMVWGYENAGLCGQIAYNGVETIGWYVSYWDSDVSYSRTGLQQFKADYLTTATDDATMSQVKSLY